MPTTDPCRRWQYKKTQHNSDKQQILAYAESCSAHKKMLAGLIDGFYVKRLQKRKTEIIKI